jgi:DNA-binding GntR family transcriptional regulator
MTTPSENSLLRRDEPAPAPGSRFDAAGNPRSVDSLPQSFPDHIRQLLEREIVEGRLAPGQRVTEDQLALDIGVSRTPVREAIRALEAQGLIVRRRARGTFVAQRATLEEAEAIYGVRSVLESQLAARAAQVMTEDELATAAELQQRFLALVDAAEAPGVQLVAADSDLHWTIYNAARSELVSIVASYWGRLQRELYDPVYRSDPHLFASQHEDLIEALRRRDPEGAREAMKRHIASGWEAVSASYTGLSEEPT